MVGAFKWPTQNFEWPTQKKRPQIQLFGDPVTVAGLGRLPFPLLDLAENIWTEDDMLHRSSIGALALAGALLMALAGAQAFDETK